MRKQIKITCFFLLAMVLYSNAQKYDYQWVFGYSAPEELQFGISLLDFNNQQLEVSLI